MGENGMTLSEPGGLDPKHPPGGPCEATRLTKAGRDHQERWLKGNFLLAKDGQRDISAMGSTRPFLGEEKFVPAQRSPFLWTANPQDTKDKGDVWVSHGQRGKGSASRLLAGTKPRHTPFTFATLASLLKERVLIVGRGRRGAAGGEQQLKRSETSAQSTSTFLLMNTGLRCSSGQGPKQDTEMKLGQFRPPEKMGPGFGHIERGGRPR